MTKLQSALTSLIAVIPALFLAYLLVAAMLSFSENFTTMAYLVAGGALIASVIIILIPAVILFGDRRKAEPAKVAVVDASSHESEDIEAIDDDVEVSDTAHGSSGSSGSFDAHNVLLESSSEMNIGDSDQDMLGGSSESEIETEPVEDLDDFDIEEEEEPKPKKKKR